MDSNWLYIHVLIKKNTNVYATNCNQLFEVIVELFFIDFVIRFIELCFLYRYQYRRCIRCNTRFIIAKYVKSRIMFHSILWLRQDETHVFFFSVAVFTHDRAWVIFQKKKKNAHRARSLGMGIRRNGGWSSVWSKAGRSASLFNLCLWLRQ